MSATGVTSPSLQGSATRRRVVAWLLSAPLAPALAACGGRSAGGRDQVPAPMAKVKFPESLTIITGYNFQQNDPGYMAAADEFARRNNVKLEISPGSGDADVTAKIAAGTPPDVFRRNHPSFHKVIADGGLRPLDPYLQQAKDLKASDYYPYLLKLQTTKGKLYALPEDFQPGSTFYYNQTLFDQAGEKYPDENWTWDRLLDTARRLTKGPGDVMDQYGYWFNSVWWDQFVYDLGGQIVDSQDDPTKCLLEQPRSIDGLQFLVDLMHKWKVTPSPQARQAVPVGNEMAWFTANRLATINHGTWATLNWSQAAQQGGTLKWGMTLAPIGQDGKRHYPTGGAGWAIATAAKTPDASWEFIKWQFGPEGWKVWLSKRDPNVFWMPALRALAEEEGKRLEKIYPNASLVVKSADFIYRRPPGVGWERALADVVTPLVNDLLANKGAVKSLVQDAVPRANAIMAQS